MDNRKCCKCEKVIAPDTMPMVIENGIVLTPVCEDCLRDMVNKKEAEIMRCVAQEVGPSPLLVARYTKSGEADPTGRKPSDPGAKLDQGKVRMGLVMGGFANALREVCVVGTKGAAKYSDNGWLEVPNGQARYMDALYRHLNKHQAGEKIDPEWRLLHLSHMAWNALATLELELRKATTDYGISIPSTKGTVAGEAPVPN